MAKTILIQRMHDDLTFMISRRSIETLTFVAAWKEFGLSLENVVALTCLPMFRETNAIKIILGKTDEKKLEAPNNDYSWSKTSNKSTFTS